MVPRQLDSTLGEPCDFGQRSAAMIPEIEIVSPPIPPVTFRRTLAKVASAGSF
jgi:hypothetical protein